RPPTSPLLPYTTLFRSLEMNKADQRTGIAGSNGVMNGDPMRANPILNAFTSLVTRKAPDGNGNGGELIYAYDGPDHVVLGGTPRSEEHTSELQSRENLV